MRRIFWLQYHQALTSYYRGLLRGRGLQHSDQQLMADERTARFARAYASDDGITFRMDFARAVMKMLPLVSWPDQKARFRWIATSLPVIFYEAESSHVHADFTFYQLYRVFHGSGSVPIIAQLDNRSRAHWYGGTRWSIVCLQGGERDADCFICW